MRRGAIREMRVHVADGGHVADGERLATSTRAEDTLLLLLLFKGGDQAL